MHTILACNLHQLPRKRWLIEGNYKESHLTLGYALMCLQTEQSRRLQREGSRQPSKTNIKTY